MPHVVVFVIKRHPELDHDQFVEHYRRIHAPLARALPGLISYQQMPIRQDSEWEGRKPEYDAVSTYTFTSDQAAEQAWTSAEGALLADDTVKCIDTRYDLALPGTGVVVHSPLG